MFFYHSGCKNCCLYINIQKIAPTCFQIWFFPPIWGEKMAEFWGCACACACKLSMAAQRSQTSGFSVGFSGGNSEQTVKQPIEVFSRKDRIHCLKAIPGYWSKIAKHFKQIFLPVIVHCRHHTAPHRTKAKELKVSIDK